MPLIHGNSEESWLVDYGHTEGLVRQVTEDIVQRRQLTIGTTQHALLSNKLRTQIPKAEKKVDELITQLDEWSLRNLTPSEKERRSRLCETLQSSLKKVDMDFRDGRGRGATGVTASGWGVVEEEEAASHRPISHLRDQQQRILEEQESGLDVLSKVISQQKRIATTIGTEVEDQNRLIDDIGDRTDNAQNRLVDETDHIGAVTQKSRTWPYWVVIAVLFIAIIIIVVW